MNTPARPKIVMFNPQASLKMPYDGPPMSILAAARAAGARGGKLLGAGGRSFMQLYADQQKHAEIKAKLAGLFPVPFVFESVGSQIIFSELDHVGRPNYK